MTMVATIPQFLGKKWLTFGVERLMDKKAHYMTLGSGLMTGFDFSDTRVSGRLRLTDDEIDALENILGRGRRMNLSRIGPTTICPACSFARKPGDPMCFRCGYTETEEIPASRFYESVLFEIEYLWRTGREISISMITSYAFSSILYNDLMWATTTIPDMYICSYCKSVVQGRDSACPYCGGGDLPFADVAKLNHQCLYCGASLRGSVVCNQCGSAESGYRVWPPGVYS